jgi:hypothetical protein
MANSEERLERMATRDRDMSNTYLSSPMTWGAIRERYPSQSVDLRNMRGEWGWFTTAQVVLDESTHGPVVRGRGLTYDTNDLEPDPVLELPPRFPRLVSVVIDRTSAGWAKLSPENRAKLERLEDRYR